MKIKNMIPALGWNAVFELTKESQVSRPLVCWACAELETVKGYVEEKADVVVGMVTDESNNVVPANSIDGFKGYDYDIDLLESEMFESMN
jgi:hypothetical protein